MRQFKCDCGSLTWPCRACLIKERDQLRAEVEAARAERDDAKTARDRFCIDWRNGEAQLRARVAELEGALTRLAKRCGYCDESDCPVCAALIPPETEGET